MTARFIPNLDNHLYLETFFVSAICGLLAVRFYLYVTGFPQVGGGGLHIAHMLWGGLLMLVGILLLLAFFGRTNRRVAAILAGAGFGIFVDELGKFLTSDNNYFFRPAPAIIYFVFLLIYGAIYLTLRSRARGHQAQLVLAFQAMVEAVAHGFDHISLRRIEEHLDLCDPSDPLSRAVADLVAHMRAQPKRRSGHLHRLRVRLDYLYSQTMESELLRNGIVFVFTMWAAVHTLTDAVSVFGLIPSRSALHGQISPGSANVAVAILTVFSLVLVAAGDIVILRDRLKAYVFFKYAMLATIFLTTEFEFYIVQFYALAGLAQAVMGLVVANGLIHREQRYRRTKRRETIPTPSEPMPEPAPN